MNPNSLQPVIKPLFFGPALAPGFAIVLAMWVVTYVLQMPGVEAPQAVTASLLALTLFAGGVLVGRRRVTRDALRQGLQVGLVAGVVNLLALGSILVDPQQVNTLKPNAALWILGWLAFSSVAVALSAGAGSLLPRTNDNHERDSAWLARLGLVTAVGVFMLIIAGGVVTSTRTGMAVADWPNTFGSNMFLYPLSRMTGGVFYEHFHRLFGALIGLATLTLSGAIITRDRRRWMSMVAVVALLFVLLQGVLGGLRVIESQRALAFVHGVTAQLFFALMVTIAAFVSTGWQAPTPEKASPDSGQRRLAMVFLVLMILQVTLGALVRHFGLSMHTIITHVTMSIVVLTVALALGFRASHAHGDLPIMRRLGKAVMHTALLQMALGVVALWVVMSHRDDDPIIKIALTTAHQAVGAGLMAIAALHAAWSARLLGPAQPTSS